MATEDQEMAARFLRGEADAVATVDGWISRAAWPYQRRLVNRWDDVLQDIRLEITRLLSQGKFRGESSLRTYLWRVVSHTCLDQIRAEGKRQWTDLEELEQGTAEGQLVDPAPVRHEDRDLLQRVLERISGECRDMWRMIVAGLSYREMSLRMGVAEGTLRVRTLRCREKAIAIRAELLATPSVPPSAGPRNIEASPTPREVEETHRT
ncbi:MAG TPA: sigma-70 family RNA polymerase sigma factor [Thermoanaerobaculia bacterium]|nr:sigma-70 family RNA polymerase sigma factor [Thermoanaerobaculia bacterium]